MSTTEKPPVAAKPKKATPTEYVVLELAVGVTNAGWREVSRINATGSNAALRKHIEKAGTAISDSTQLVAVPARSWQPVKPKTTTKTITTLEAL